MIYKTEFESPLGILHLVSDGEKLIGLWFEGQKYFQNGIEETVEEKQLEVFDKTKKWLDLYFKRQNPKINIPILPKGNRFRQDVWNILLKIPYGETTTYGKIAKQLEIKYNKKMSAQAIGGAVGHNPISIIIPCHRVIGRDGKLTGYAGGIDKKIKLLELENIDTTKLKI